MKTNGKEPITPFADIAGRIASNLDMAHLEGMGAMIGLTKREYFAGLAMSSYYGGEFIGQSGMPFEIIAQNCVLMADALIFELNK